jgi:hypothetical protein
VRKIAPFQRKTGIEWTADGPEERRAQSNNSKDNLPALVRAFAREHFMRSARLGKGHNGSNGRNQILRVEHIGEPRQFPRTDIHDEIV